MRTGPIHLMGVGQRFSWQGCAGMARIGKARVLWHGTARHSLACLARLARLARESLARQIVWHVLACSSTAWHAGRKFGLQLWAPNLVQIRVPNLAPNLGPNLVPNLGPKFGPPKLGHNFGRQNLVAKLGPQI